MLASDAGLLLALLAAGLLAAFVAGGLDWLWEAVMPGDEEDTND